MIVEITRDGGSRSGLAMLSCRRTSSCPKVKDLLSNKLDKTCIEEQAPAHGTSTSWKWWIISARLASDQLGLLTEEVEKRNRGKACRGASGTGQ